MADTLETSHPAPSGGFWPFWLSLCILFAFCALGLIQGQSGYEFIQESGAIENASAAIFLCGALGFAVLRPDIAFGRSWQVTAIMVLFCARELDFDKRFTEKGILQLRLYTGDYPLDHQAIGAAFVVLILVTLYRLARHGTRALTRGVLSGSGWAWAVAISVVTVVIAKSIDGAGRKLAPYGVELTEQMTLALSIIEEMFELGFGLLLVLAICLWCRQSAEEAAAPAFPPVPPRSEN